LPERREFLPRLCRRYSRNSAKRAFRTTNIVARLDAAGDRLIELRAQLARLSNDRQELAAIRLQALALIDAGDLDGAVRR